MLERIRKLIERYSRISAEHSTAATMNDEFSKGVCSVVDGVVSDLKKVEVEMSKLKLFKCTFVKLKELNNFQLSIFHFPLA